MILHVAKLKNKAFMPILSTALDISRYTKQTSSRGLQSNAAKIVRAIDSN